ncbi:MAG TPA: lytic transglycosylase domain-containing protein [Candidatus Kapabacteria bacterium]|nr:lytic transglycosylase domain-containing protein [Candidatus Kapabacteria bacterium]
MTRTTKHYLQLGLTLAAAVLLARNAIAQTPGVSAPCMDEAPLFSENSAAEYSALSRGSVEHASKVAYSALSETRRYNSALNQERGTMAQVADAYLDFYPQTEYLRILSTPNRPAIIAPPFRLKTRAEAGSGTMPGIPSATLSRLYRSDSSVASLMEWYRREYGFDFKVHRTPLSENEGATLTVARAVKQVGNALVTVMIWTPSATVEGKRGSRTSSLLNKTSVEVQERAFRPRGELIAEGPDAVVEMTWKVPFRDLIQRVSMKYQIDPHLVAALLQQESNFNPNAISVDSAMGLAQMIPGTAEMLGVTNPNDPHQAIEGGVRYLKMLLSRFKGNVEFALAGYNAGPGNVEKYRGIPPFAETRDYVRRIIARYKEKAAGTFAPVAKLVRPNL